MTENKKHKMKVTLINAMESGAAARLLVYTKQTRLTQGHDTRKAIEMMTWTEILNELGKMSKTIPSSWEFVDYVFEITGVTRAFTHQFVRTRTGSYAQQTMRILNMEDFAYETGPSINENCAASQRYSAIMAAINQAYKDLIADGAKEEDARGVLPTNICTNIIAKFNLRTLSEMARSRRGMRTQNEYRNVLEAMIAEVIAAHPWADIFLNPPEMQPVMDMENEIRGINSLAEELHQRRAIDNAEFSEIARALTAMAKSMDQVRKEI